MFNKKFWNSVKQIRALTFEDEARVGDGLVLCFPNVIDVVQDGAVEEIEA